VPHITDVVASSRRISRLAQHKPVAPVTGIPWFPSCSYSVEEKKSVSGG
jgi:hypothetical protein